MPLARDVDRATVFRVRGFFPGVLLLPTRRASQRRNPSSEHVGKANPCHGATRVATLDNEILCFAALFYGRYWARTSDPQLVEPVGRYAEVRACSRVFAAFAGLFARLNTAFSP